MSAPPWSYTLETTGPAVAISSPGGTTNVASQTLSGSVTENLVAVGTTVDLYDTVNGSETPTLIGTATVSASGGTWTTSTPIMLQPGTNGMLPKTPTPPATPG